MRLSRRTGPLVLVLLCTLMASVVQPALAQAAPSPFGNGAAWSVPMRHYAALSPQPNGGIVANTAIMSGGVPSDGDALVGIDATGTASWNVPYQNQDRVDTGPVVDAAGNAYQVLNPGGTSEGRLIAFTGSTERWSKPFTEGINRPLVVGANGQVYSLTGRTLHSFNASDGNELFADVTLDRDYEYLFAYDKGLIVYSDSGRVARYFGYDGRLLGGPFTAPDTSGFHDVAASATGELFVFWYTQQLLSEACFDANAHAILNKFTPSGAAWTKALPDVTRCNHGGPYVAATPDGGAIVASHTDTGVDVQYVNGSGQPGWRQTITSPAGTYLRVAQPPHVDATGHVLLATNFTFGCNLWSDVCAGMQVSHFAADGAPQSPIVLMGDTSANQQSWLSNVWKSSVALVPGKVALTLLHRNGGVASSEANYSVDAFNVPGLTGAYPQTVLRKGAGSGTTPPPPPSPSNPAYVALGDSYSSGEGAFDYYADSNNPGTFNSCHRSSHAYGPLLNEAAKLGSMTFGACSGAVTDDFFVTNPVNPNEPAQMNRLTPDTKVVTLTIGGNDAGFAHIITKCTDGFRDWGAPGEELGAYGCSSNTQLRRDVNARFAALSGRPDGSLIIGRPIHPLVEIYKEIHRRAPHAQVVVAGYPRLFGTRESNYPKQKGAPSGRACQLGKLVVANITWRYRVDYLDALWIDGLANRLNAVTESAVTAARKAGVPITYVSADRFNGHGLCDSAGSWFHGLEFIGNTQNVAPATFHPNAVGQRRGYAEAFTALLRRGF